MGKIKYFITLTTLLFSVGYAFAYTIDKSIYGVFSEHYKGVNFDESKIEDDSVRFYKWDESGIEVTTSKTIVYSTYTKQAEQDTEYSTNKDDFVEGFKFVRIFIHANSPVSWAGAGYCLENNESKNDMSKFYEGSIKFYLRTSGSDVEDNVSFGLTCGGSDRLKLLKNIPSVDLKNGWKEYTFELKEINITGITSQNLVNTKNLFIFNYSGNLLSGTSATFDLDNVRFVSKDSAEFEVSVKKLDGTDVSYQDISVSWDNVKDFKSGWKTAQQYLELSFNGNVSSRLGDNFNNWSIHIYTNTGNAEKNGLISDPEDPVVKILPLCWRMSKVQLSTAEPFEPGKDSIFIKQKIDHQDDPLYDEALGNEYYPWFFMQDKASSGTQGFDDYTTIWNYKGIHVASTTEEFGYPYSSLDDSIVSGTNYLYDSYTKTVKLYFGCDTSNATNKKYKASIIIDLIYE